LWTLGHAYYLTEKRQEALDAFGQIVQRNPNFVPAHAYRAVVLSELGRAKEARQAWDEAIRISPSASMSNLRERLPYKRPADLDRLSHCRASRRHAVTSPMCLQPVSCDGRRVQDEVSNLLWVSDQRQVTGVDLDRFPHAYLRALAIDSA